jgi:F-type H+-transporting ATPase subunit epsilon
VASKGISVVFSAPGEKPLRLEVSEIVLPGEDGVFTVLPGHTPFLSTLIPGVVVAYPLKGTPRHFAVAGGIVEVRDDAVKVLADLFEEGQRIDPARAQAAKERAEQRLKSPTSEVDLERAEAALRRSMARLGAHAKEGF